MTKETTGWEKLAEQPWSGDALIGMANATANNLEILEEQAKCLRPVWNWALNVMASVVKAEWGPRCTRFEAGCAACMAWAVYDQMEKITDGSVLDFQIESKP